MNDANQVKDEQQEEQQPMMNEEVATEEVTVEATEHVVEENDEVKALKEELQKKDEKIAELESRYFRTHADFENIKRRLLAEQEAQKKYRAQALITELLPVLDNFDRALNITSDDDQVLSILNGMRMVQRQLLEALINEGIEEIPTAGEQFDPYVHQAVMQVSEEGFESNVVVEAFQKGYKLKDRVIRPAMVKVNE